MRPGRAYVLSLSERMGMTAGELLGRMSSRELAERMALDAIRADSDLMAGLREKAMAGVIDARAKRKAKR